MCVLFYYLALTHTIYNCMLYNVWNKSKCDSQRSGLCCLGDSSTDFFLHGILDHQGLPGGVLLVSGGVLAERLAAMLKL